MGNKAHLITPFLMLLAGAIASIIMYIREFDFYTMLWVLLIVLLVFYLIGDIVRYLYLSIRPRIIPNMDYEDIEIPVRVSSDYATGNVVEYNDIDDDEINTDDEGESEGEPSDDTYSDDEGYSDEDLEEYSEDGDE